MYAVDRSILFLNLRLRYFRCRVTTASAPVSAQPQTAKEIILGLASILCSLGNKRRHEDNETHQSISPQPKKTKTAKVVSAVYVFDRFALRLGFLTMP